MKHRIAAIAACAMALMVGVGAVAHYASSARASQPATAAPATPVPGSYLDPVAPAAVPANTMPAVGGVAAVSPNAAVPMVAAPAAAGTVATPVVYRDRVVTRTRTVPVRRRYYVHERSSGHAAEIIGGSVLGGAGVGALVGGKKGALIGGLVGGAAGTVYERKTHKKVVRE